MGRGDSLVLVDNLSSDGVTIKALVVVQHEHCQEEKAMENYSSSLRISKNS